MNYSEIKSTLDRISNQIMAERKRLKQQKDLITKSRQALEQMGTAYIAFVTEIDTLATDNPDDSAFQFAKSEKDKLVVEFQALKTVAEGMETGVGTYNP